MKQTLMRNSAYIPTATLQRKKFWKGVLEDFLCVKGWLLCSKPWHVIFGCFCVEGIAGFYNYFKIRSTGSDAHVRPRAHTSGHHNILCGFYVSVLLCYIICIQYIRRLHKSRV